MYLKLCLIIVIIIFLIYYHNLNNHISDEYNVFKNYCYFDNAATTALSNSAKNAYDKFKYSGNINSENAISDKINNYIAHINMDICRKLMNTDDATVIWNSGASEGNNFILDSFKDKKVLVNSTDHTTSILNAKYNNYTVANLFEVLEQDTQKIKEFVQEYDLISIMLVNNETGAVYKVDKLYSVILELQNESLFKFPILHCDVVQAVGKLDVIMPGDVITLSAHKFHGPIGVGAVVCKNNVLSKLTPLIKGTQQNSMRGGTINVAGIMASYAAFSDSMCNISNIQNRMLNYKHKILLALQNTYGPFIKHTDLLNQSDDFGFASDGKNKISISIIMGNQVPNILGFSVIKFTDKTKHFCNLILKKYLRDNKIIIATGSACSNGKNNTLLNMRLPFIFRCGFLRISFSKYTTEKEVDKLIKYLILGINNQKN